MIRFLIAFLIVAIGAIANPVGPVPFSVLPDCPSGGLGVTASTGVFVCNSFGSGTGDVVGPGSSTDGHFAIFNGTTGKLLKDTLAIPGTAATVNTGTSGATLGLLNANKTDSGTNVFSGLQSVSPETISAASSTLTPTGTKQDYVVTLVHANTPFTLANMTSIPPGNTHGLIKIIQSSTGSDLINSYGAAYQAPGGVATLVLSTAANAVDIFGYISDGTVVYLFPNYTFSH